MIGRCLDVIIHNIVWSNQNYTVAGNLQNKIKPETERPSSKRDYLPANIPLLNNTTKLLYINNIISWSFVFKSMFFKCVYKMYCC